MKNVISQKMQGAKSKISQSIKNRSALPFDVLISNFETFQLFFHDFHKKQFPFSAY